MARRPWEDDVRSRRHRPERLGAMALYAALVLAGQFDNELWDFLPFWLLTAALVGAVGCWALGFRRAVVAATTVQVGWRSSCSGCSTSTPTAS